MVKVMDSATLRQEISALIKSKGLSQDAVGKSIGRSGSAISLWLKGSYSGDVQELETRLRGFMEKALGRESVIGRAGAFVQTRVAKIFHEIAYQAHLECELAVLVADAGMGKTTAAEEYARRHPEVLLVPANMSYTARVLFLKLCELLSLDPEGNVNTLLNRVVTKLKGSGNLVMIDQAEYLPDRALELLRTVYDDAKVGVLLFGLPRLQHNLQKSKGSHAQLYSRVGLFQHIKVFETVGTGKVPALSLADAALIVKSRVSGAVDINALYEHCGFNARTLDKLIRRAKSWALNNDRDIDAEVVLEASKQLMG